MWSDICLFRASGWLDPNPNPNSKEGKRGIFRLGFVFESTCFSWMFRPRVKWSDLMESIFESYLELDDDVWSARGCSSEECDRFVSDNIFLRGSQAEVKNVSICIIMRVWISVWCHREPSGIHRYSLWTGLSVKYCLVYITFWHGSDTLTDRLVQKRIRMWNCTIL